MKEDCKNEDCKKEDWKDDYKKIEGRGFVWGKIR